MGIHIIKMPDIGEGIAEVELAGWHVKVGDVVAEDQPLADVMTDKATVEIPSPVVGTVVSLGGQEGDVMAVGGELIRLEVEGAGNQKGGAAAGGATSRASASSSGNRATASDDDEGDADHMATNAPVDVPAADSVAADGIVAEGATSNGGAVTGGNAKSAKAASASSASGSSSTSSSRADASASASLASSSASHGSSSAASSVSAKPVERHEPADVHALNAKSAASPAVRKRARDLGIDLPDVQGSGPAGRIQHEDLDAHLLAGKAAQTASPASASAGATGSAAPAANMAKNAGASASAAMRSGGAPAPAPRSTAEVRSYADEDFVHDRYEQRHDEHQVPVIGLRRKIAQKMVESKTRIPHYSYVEEIDVTDLETLRAQLNQKWGEKRGKLTILPFLIRAIVMALPDFPQINARFDDDSGVVTRFGAVHLGVAAQSDAGLMVPVIRHAESRDMWSLASEITRLAQAVRSGSVRREEMSGSTITVTSLGALGGIVTTPVINHPEVGIVGVNRIVERPMYRNGVVVPRKLMNLSSSFDHRVVDGMDAAEFIQAVRALLEQPAMLFVD
ncbi:dihydrolipoamide acetyltransferase family protein [Schauerella aestuarii]|uniref:dihydrolipoamide acetyltransferase family protein n=1 Tax=Schauerella aestuarii TaxID=2511204 RepID=UPI00136A76E0|nr:dihydrolipoamide acetyltransferase family protein [Achromobacter aestuarii]MYZ42446.1 2-oxo acid dehydrogenase subunit E2 [Achromobacter aestuarii]